MLTMGAAGLLEVAWASSGTIAMKILVSVKRVVDFNVKIRVKTTTSSPTFPPQTPNTDLP
jgi:hypothetical protein